MDRVNKKVMKQILSVVLLILYTSTCINNVVGQHGGEAEIKQHDDHGELHHKLTLVMAYSLLNSQLEESSTNILVVPTFGLNYDYLFNYISCYIYGHFFSSRSEMPQFLNPGMRRHRKRPPAL